ncbi:pIIIa [Mastadenovirus eidoli]|uniref:PIIIa n=1 Tax=Eidolon helvum adenovirus TaxID=2039267 RepID=A0A348FKG2_9ADEN|nr:pIIIa [Eidolon helvum adenovirus]BBF72829.1 pIIIa [Eidolon helvum adenovirus]
MARMNPTALADFQSQPASREDWADTFKRVLSLTKNNPENFASQPKANRFNAILETVVPSRTNPTHEKVLCIVNALIDSKAIRKDEAGQMYNALLERVSKYNSTNIQSNLDKLVGDVREATAFKEKTNQNVGSLVALNSFLSTLPATVERGQNDYTSFISALRIFVSETPQTEVYQAGPNYYLQTTRNGSQTVNLTRAFENLKSMWGVNSTQATGTSVSSLLNPNTRLLLLLLAPFTTNTSISRSSYIGYLLSLYRETLGTAHIEEKTYQEIQDVSRALGQDNSENLQATLNYLLTNRPKKLPEEHFLTDHEEKILRYVQQAISLYMMQTGATATTALDRTSASFEPSFYAKNRAFINKLMGYLYKAAETSSDYFLNAVLNRHWLPPQGFFTGDFDFPEVDDGYIWEDFDSALFGREQDKKSFSGSIRPHENQDFQSYQSNFSRDSVSSALGAVGPAPSYSPLQEPRIKNFPLLNNEMESITDKFARWKTHAQEQKEIKEKLQRSDDISGTGFNQFKHLMPNGGKY